MLTVNLKICKGIQEVCKALDSTCKCKMQIIKCQRMEMPSYFAVHLGVKLAKIINQADFAV